MTVELHELVAATHTPFDPSGELNVAAIERQADFLHSKGIRTLFIGGSTGESHSLSVVERFALTQRWSEVIRGTELRMVVHVGTNCLSDARTLAVHAESFGAVAISALAPSYFKPKSMDSLVDCCESIASSAPQTPFYFYDIPSLTGVAFSMKSFLEQAQQQIPTLAGIKFTNADLMMYQLCLQFDEGKFDIPWGVDECLLAALSLGAQGAVGSSYNFAAPLYLRIIAAFNCGDLATARMEQYRSVQLIELLASYGYMGAAKCVMGMLGVDVGFARLPNTRLSPQQQADLKRDLERLGFFDWV